MDIKGKVIELSDVMQVTDSFKKRELVIEYAENPTYPEFIKFEALQDRAALLDQVKVNDMVEVFFNLKGRPWTDKTGKKSYFNTLVIWKVNVLGAEGNVPEYAQTNQADVSSSPGEDDDLPF